MVPAAPKPPKPPVTDMMECRACGRPERASEGYPCTKCGTFLCVICTFQGITLCRRCQGGSGTATPAP